MASEFQILEWWVYYKFDLLDHDNDGYHLSPNYDPNEPAKVDLTLCLGSLS
jgi:hypothetical protein